MHTPYPDVLFALPPRTWWQGKFGVKPTNHLLYFPNLPFPGEQEEVELERAEFGCCEPVVTWFGVGHSDHDSAFGGSCHGAYEGG